MISYCQVTITIVKHVCVDRIVKLIFNSKVAHSTLISFNKLSVAPVLAIHGHNISTQKTARLNTPDVNFIKNISQDQAQPNFSY